MILIGLQKVFSTVNHEIVFSKMKNPGFSKKLVACLKFYRNGQKFQRNIKANYSSPSNVICVIPPKELVSPGLFLILRYINDLLQAIVSYLFMTLC